MTFENLIQHHYLKKDFRHKFSFLADSLNPPTPIDGQNPVSVET